MAIEKRDDSVFIFLGVLSIKVGMGHPFFFPKFLGFAGSIKQEFSTLR